MWMPEVTPTVTPLTNLFIPRVLNDQVHLPATACCSGALLDIQQ